MSTLFKPQDPSLKFAKHVRGTGIIHQFCVYPDAQLKKKQKTATDCLVLSSLLQVYFFLYYYH